MADVVYDLLKAVGRYNTVLDAYAELRKALNGNHQLQRLNDMISSYVTAETTDIRTAGGPDIRKAISTHRYDEILEALKELGNTESGDWNMCLYVLTYAIAMAVGTEHGEGPLNAALAAVEN